MAYSHLLCSQLCNPDNKRDPITTSSENYFSLLTASRSSFFCQNVHFARTSSSMQVMGSEVRNSRRRIVKTDDSKNSKTNIKSNEVGKNAEVSTLSLFSPCKINVFLRITGRRGDGFHELASLFHVISLGDIISFSLSSSKTKDTLSSNVGGVPLDDRNLIIKSLNLYRRKTGSDNYFLVHLDKRVPTGAGLGGGSSNAATSLWAANQFLGCCASEKELQEWSCEIGSDVPFFFSLGAAYCTGRGEIVEDISSPVHPGARMVLIKPQESCSTAEVYKRVRLNETSAIDPLMLLRKIALSGISQDACINDLESPAFEVVPSLKALKQRMCEGGYDAVFMSGSGSTMVGVGSAEAPEWIRDCGVFCSEAYFITRQPNLWYGKPASP